MADYPQIQIYILTYNRPKLLVNSIDSVLRQTYPNVELIVSDNSTNDDTFKVLSSRNSWGRYKYIRRNPSMSGVEHLVTVFEEVNTDFFMVFHDDDEMLPNMVEELFEAITADVNYSAVGANAYAMKNGKKKLFFPPHNAVIPDGESLIRRYVNKTIAPFPSYMYNRKIVRELRPDYNNQGGKYCDVSFLFNLAQCGPMIYVGKPLMIYNLHSGQDSGDFDFLKHIQLTDYLLRKLENRELLNEYRLYQIYKNVILGLDGKKIKFQSRLVRLFWGKSSYIILLKYLVRVLFK